MILWLLWGVIGWGWKKTNKNFETVWFNVSHDDLSVSFINYDDFFLSNPYDSPHESKLFFIFGCLKIVQKRKERNSIFIQETYCFVQNSRGNEICEKWPTVPPTYGWGKRLQFTSQDGSNHLCTSLKNFKNYYMRTDDDVDIWCML